jgi:hypothetical protein
MSTLAGRLSSSRLASVLYKPLDEGRDEIRLITIEPLQPGGPMQCDLHKALLNDTREEYSRFIKSADADGKSARRVLVQ